MGDCNGTRTNVRSRDNINDNLQRSTQGSNREGRHRVYRRRRRASNIPPTITRPAFLLFFCFFSSFSSFSFSLLPRFSTFLVLVAGSRQFSGSFRHGSKDLLSCFLFVLRVFFFVFLSGPPPQLVIRNRRFAWVAWKLEDIFFSVPVAIQTRCAAQFRFWKSSNQLSQVLIQQPRCFGNHAASRFFIFFGVFSSFRCFVV